MKARKESEALKSWSEELAVLARKLAGAGFQQSVPGPPVDVLAMRIARKAAPPLTALAAIVLHIIEEFGPIRGIQIIAKVRRLHKRVLAQGTLTGHIIPQLTPRGVRNDGDGYYRVRP